jgi:hypothetical protein
MRTPVVNIALIFIIAGACWFFEWLLLLYITYAYVRTRQVGTPCGMDSLPHGERGGGDKEVYINNVQFK